jgi:hypothetical protein
MSCLCDLASSDDSAARRREPQAAEGGARKRRIDRSETRGTDSVRRSERFGTRVVLGGPGTGRIGMRRIPFPGSDVTASFDLAAFKAMPPGDVEVVLFVVDTGEHKCRISGKERQAIR